MLLQRLTESCRSGLRGWHTALSFPARLRIQPHAACTRALSLFSDRLRDSRSPNSRPAMLSQPSGVPMLAPPLLGSCRHESIRRRMAKERPRLSRRRIPLVPASRWAIYPRDYVHVYSHHRKVGEGTVLQCIRKRNQVIVQGVNVQTEEKIDRSDPGKAKTKTVSREQPVHYSSVNLVDPVDGRRTRIRFGYLENGRRVRLAIRSGAVIERVPHTPRTSYEERIARPIPPFATAREDVVERTYVPP